MEKMKKIPVRVLLVDDHALMRSGIRATLEEYPDIEIVGEASNGKKALSQARSKSPDVVLMDISMPVMGGIEATQALCRRKPPRPGGRSSPGGPPRIIVLTMHENVEYARQVIDAGGKGYLLKDSTPEELVRAIRQVAGGGEYFSSRILKKLEAQDASGPAGLKSLSQREREVLKLLADSLRNKEIAAKLAISVRTVEVHRGRIMKKLGVENVAGLIRYAIAHGLI